MVDYTGGDSTGRRPIPMRRARKDRADVKWGMHLSRLLSAYELPLEQWELKLLAAVVDLIEEVSKIVPEVYPEAASAERYDEEVPVAPVDDGC